MCESWVLIVLSCLWIPFKCASLSNFNKENRLFRGPTSRTSEVPLEALDYRTLTKDKLSPWEHNERIDQTNFTLMWECGGNTSLLNLICLTLYPTVLGIGKECVWARLMVLNGVGLKPILVMELYKRLHGLWTWLFSKAEGYCCSLLVISAH